ncbi:insulinase family protein [Candidatus Sumerlaeota bacterium]|nr:insulinase family protein [Candidatus Sumerlaeota bacterium]
MKQFVLKNKMPVLIMEEPDSRVVTLDVWVNTGSVNESPGINGVSHFLEHMLFKGTKTRGVGEIDAEIEALGGIWNAGTSLEFTHYYLTLAAPFVEKGVDTLSDVIANAALDPVEMEKERQVILEEYHRQQDDPSHFLFTEAMRLSFEKSPYKRPVLGVPKTIDSISRENLFQYYESRYAPENMVLVIAGAVKAVDILPRLEENFGALERPFDPNGFTTDTVTLRRFGVRREFKKPVQESYILFTFPAPDLSHPDEVYAADLLSYILGEGRSSRLCHNVKEDKKLVSMIASEYPTHRKDGVFSIFATFDYSRKDDLIQAISEELEQIRDKKVKTPELEKAKRMITNQLLFSQETSNGRTSEMGFYYTLTGDTRFAESYIDNIRKVAPGKIRDIALKYIDPDQANIFIVRPLNND